MDRDVVELFELRLKALAVWAGGIADYDQRAAAVSVHGLDCIRERQLVYSNRCVALAFFCFATEPLGFRELRRGQVRHRFRIEDTPEYEVAKIATGDE